MIRWQNPAARRTYGDRAGLKVGSVVLRDAGNDVDARLGEILWNGEAADFSLRAKLPDGRTERIEVCAVPVFGGGAAVGVFGVSQSVARGVPVRRTSNRTGTHGPAVRRARAVSGRQVDARDCADPWNQHHHRAEPRGEPHCAHSVLDLLHHRSQSHTRDRGVARRMFREVESHTRRRAQRQQERPPQERARRTASAIPCRCSPSFRDFLDSTTRHCGRAFRQPAR